MCVMCVLVHVCVGACVVVFVSTAQGQVYILVLYVVKAAWEQHGWLLLLPKVAAVSGLDSVQRPS